MLVGIAEFAALLLLVPTADLAPPMATGPVAVGSAADWITGDDYPKVATVLNLQGDTSIELVIGTDGRVSRCTVVASSGHDTLDLATCRLLTERGVFLPAHDAAGQPIEGSFVRRVRWRLPDEGVELADGLQRNSFEVDRNGEVKGCTVHMEGRIPDIQKGFCDHMPVLPPYMLSALGDPAHAPFRAQVETGFALSEAVQTAHLAVPKGWKRHLLSAAWLTVDPTGQPTNCQIYESRGPENAVLPICSTFKEMHFKPFLGKDGKAEERRVGIFVAFFSAITTP